MMQATVATLTGQDVPATSAQLPATAGTVPTAPLPNSAGGAQYDGNGNATAGGVTSPPANTGAALAGAITGMVQDVAARSKSNGNNAFSDVPVPGTPTTNTETVIVQAPASVRQNALLMWGTVICVAAAGVTLYQAHAAHHHNRGGERKHHV